MSIKPAHSPIGASSYYRWKACPGSIKLSRGIESKSSKYAEEGTRAHTVCDQVLKTGEWPRGLDEEMKDAVLVYVNEIIGNSWDKSNTIVYVEHRFDLSSLYPGLYGTADCVLYDSDCKLLQVYDFKYGAGIPVEVCENGIPNSQLMYYALGALLTLGPLVDEVELVIVQPRCFHPEGPIRRVTIPAFEFLDFAATLREDAVATESPDAPIIPGSHCRFCPAAGICPTVHEKALALAKEEFSQIVPYDPEKLSKALHWLPALEGWIEQVRAFAYSEAKDGKTIPGWKLVEKRKTRRWCDEQDVKEALTPILGDEIYKTTLKTPAQIEKLLNKDQKQLLPSLIVAESSGVSLAPQDDPRGPIRNEARLDFESNQ